eukprot:scaffold1314_cov386-Pavlova_lutheri.AAC.24
MHTVLLRQMAPSPPPQHTRRLGSLKGTLAPMRRAHQANRCRIKTRTPNGTGHNRRRLQGRRGKKGFWESCAAFRNENACPHHNLPD